MFKGLKPIVYGGREVWPLVEGGKGVSATNHMSSGAWAAAGGIGTVSGVNPDSYDARRQCHPANLSWQAPAPNGTKNWSPMAIAGGTEQIKRAL